MSKEACSICGKTKASIGAKIREMENMGVMVLSHDLIAYCENCEAYFCSDHYDLDDMAGTHRCRKCGSDLRVERTGYIG